MLTVEERYARDPHFHSLVGQLRQLIARAEFTPTELREALILALMQHEREHPRPMCFASTKTQAWARLLEPAEYVRQLSKLRATLSSEEERDG